LCIAPNPDAAVAQQQPIGLGVPTNRDGPDRSQLPAKALRDHAKQKYPGGPDIENGDRLSRGPGMRG
jgi:hypothetical protein